MSEFQTGNTFNYKQINRLVYNDVFSKSMNIFGTAWKINASTLDADFTSGTSDDTDEYDLYPSANYRGDPYFIGLDPAWQVSFLCKRLGG